MAQPTIDIYRSGEVNLTVTVDDTSVHRSALMGEDVLRLHIQSRTALDLDIGDYIGVRRRVYTDGASFVPVCEKCGRFVKSDSVIYKSDIRGLSPEPNATCSKCGRVHMIFDGFRW